MVIKSELEYRYVLKSLDGQLEFMKELHLNHMSDLAKALPELCNNGMYVKVEKVRNAVILGFKKNNGHYPFNVDI